MQENPKSPDITSLVIIFLKNFGGNVVRGSHDLVSTGSLKFWLHLFFPVEGKSEVDEHDVVIVGAAKEEVLCLEVSMAYFL